MHPLPCIITITWLATPIRVSRDDLRMCMLKPSYVHLYIIGLARIIVAYEVCERSRQRKQWFAYYLGCVGSPNDYIIARMMIQWGT